MRTLLAVVAILGVACAGSARADEATAAARSHFREGARLYKQARYREAIAEFQAAYQAKPNGVVLFNIAQCHEKLGELPEAIRNYQEYLREVPNASDRETVEAVIANLQRRQAERSVQKLEVRTEPPGAAVAVDGQARGQTPYSGEHAVGAHQVDVSLSGYVPVSRQVVLTPDAAALLDLTLAREAPAAPAEAVSTQPPSPPKSPKRVWTWVAAGSAGALLAGAVTMGLMAQANQRALLNTGVHTKPGEADQLYRAATSDATAANALYGGTAVVGAGAVTLFFVEGSF